MDDQKEAPGNQKTTGRSLRGFASMDKEKQKTIASKGGRAAHEKGTAHEFNSNEASEAARKGHARGTAHEFTSEEARAAGRKGGMARASSRRSQGSGSSEGTNNNSGSQNQGSETQTASSQAAGQGRLDATPAMADQNA